MTDTVDLKKYYIVMLIISTTSSKINSQRPNVYIPPPASIKPNNDMLTNGARLTTPKKGDHSQLKQIKNNVLNIYYNLYQVIKHHSVKIALTNLLVG